MSKPSDFGFLLSSFSASSIVVGILAISAVLVSVYLAYRGVLFLLDMLIGYDMYRHWDGD